jgi:phosphoserine phosphatase
MFQTVVTIIADRARPVVDNALVSRMALTLDNMDFGEVRTDILKPGGAVDILIKPSVERVDKAELIGALRQAAGDAPVDLAIQPVAGRRKKLLIADMDSTIIAQECLDELADFAGVKAEISAITERAMRGELDFDGALTERVAMLKGLAAEYLERCYLDRITLNPGARTLVHTMQADGAFTALVSGGFTFFTERVAATAGFQTNRANTLGLENGALTGDVGRPILGRAAKLEALTEFADAQKLSMSETLAVGDGANDLDMINAAGLGVAFHAKPAVAAAADAAINHGDLTALLYLQGYREKEFVD